MGMSMEDGKIGKRPQEWSSASRIWVGADNTTPSEALQLHQIFRIGVWRLDEKN